MPKPKTIRFHPPPNDPPESIRAVPLPNPLDRVTEIMRDIGLLEEKCSQLFATTNRHGDLMVMRGATLRLEQSLAILIENEERQESG